MPKHLSRRLAVINPDNVINTAFNFQLSQPPGPLSTLVQGVWAASVPPSNSIVKRLYSDAGSGIVFNLAGELTIGDEVLPEGVIMLPVHKQAETIVLSPGAELAGIRFHPAMGYGVLGQHYSKPSLLPPEEGHLHSLYEVYDELRVQKGERSRVESVYRWAEKNVNVTHVIPSALEKALECIEEDNAVLSALDESTALSQRQVERLFKRWTGMTPKHCQRILRIKKAIGFMKQHESVSLAGVAQQFGFSDQAHMTREFRAIAHITPGQV